MRYPTGEEGNCPYPTAKEHSGYFGLTLVATVHAFQKDAAAGNGLKRLSIPAGDAGKLTGSWPYLLTSSAKTDKSKIAALPTTGGAAATVGVDTLKAVTSGAASDASAAGSKARAGEESEDIDWSWDWKLKGESPKLATEAGLGVGVVTATVGEAIAKWRDAGYVKPGPIVVQSNLQPGCWARPELAISLALWNAMAKALGCAYGIKLLCTFRELTVPAGVGRVECSNHKLGLSVDLLSLHLRDTREQWPIHYEANWVASPSSVTTAQNRQVSAAQAKLDAATKRREKTEEYLKGLDEKEAAGKRVPVGAREAGQTTLRQLLEREEEMKANLAAEEAKVAEIGGRVEAAKSNYYLCWRIYGHSSLKIWTSPKDPKNPDGEWNQVPAAELQASLAVADAFGVTSDGSPWKIETKTGELVRGFFPPASDATTKAAIDGIVAEAQAKARKIAKMLYRMAGDRGKEGLVASLFRRTIRPFDYNPFEADGGTSKPEQTVDTDTKLALAQARFGNSPIHSYLNLTRLGFYCGMTRIAAQRKVSTGTFKRPDADPEYSPKMAPKDVVFRLVPVEDGKNRGAGDISGMLSTLARLLGDLAKAPEAGAPKVVFEDGTEQTVPLADLDKTFVKTWAELMNPQAGLGLSFEDTSLSLGLSADQDSFDARLKRLEDVMAKTFLLVRAGAVLQVNSEVGKKKSLREWSTILADRQERMGDEFKKIKGSRAKRSTDWAMALFPCFSPEVAKEKRLSAIVLPACGAPAPLEWWHYDSKAMTGSWADMAEAVGYSSAVVRADDNPPATIVDGQYTGGLGFDPRRVEKVRTPPSTAPENFSTIPKGG